MQPLNIHNSTPDDIARFGDKLRQWRRMADIKQQRLADILGVTQATISRWEKGGQHPSPFQYRLLHDMMTRNRNLRLDHAITRLVKQSRQRVHLIEDRSHRLLCSSLPRQREWQRDDNELLGQSLWRFATREIAAAEKSLHHMGWHEGQADHVLFANSARDGGPMRIIDQYILWERFYLADGRAVRLTTGFDHRPQNY